jgi:Domain of unknown function (DUF4390)
MPAWSRRNFLGAVALGLLSFCLPSVGHAEGIQLVQAELVQHGEIWQLSGGYDIQLSPTLEDALKRGVQLSFLQEFEAVRPRDFWFSEDIAKLSRVIRISYNALLRQYYVTVSGHSETYTNLPDALRAAGDFGDWSVLHQSQLDRKNTYRVSVHMYLDSSQLPKPLQVNAVASQRWQLDSDWREWMFKP